MLPFQNMSGDPEQEYFADGMVEEITSAIARLPWLFVISRNSSFTYKGRAVDVKQVARELGVRYVLEGSVRKGGNRVRITGQLIDTATCAHIWADRFDGALARDDPDVIWQAGWSLFVFAGETAMAIAIFDRALALNPNAAMAWGAKGWVHAFRNQPEAAIEALDRGLRLSPFDPLGHYFATGFAYAHLFARRFEEAIEWADRALHDQPSYTPPIRINVVANAHLGRLNEARAALAQLLAINPRLTIARLRALSAPSQAPEVLNLIVAGMRLAGLPEG